MSRRLVLVGPVAPPSGGVATHVDDLRRAVAHGGGDAIVLDGSRRRAARLALGLALGRARGDLVHLHTNGHNAGSWRLAALVGAASDGALLTIHSGLAPAYLAGHVAPRALRRFQIVFCVSSTVADAVAAVDPSIGARLAIAPAFSPATLPLPLPPAALAALRARHRPLLAAALGDGDEYGAALLVAGFAELRRSFPDAGLVLFSPGARAPSVTARVTAAALEGRVHHLGDLPRAESLGVLAAADLFVRPTLADGDAISVREALALGRRVLASDAVARPEGTARFIAGDVASLVAAARDALAAPAPPPSATDGAATVLIAYRAAGVLSPSLSAGGL